MLLNPPVPGSGGRHAQALLGEFYTGRLIRQGNASNSRGLAGIFERLRL